LAKTDNLADYEAHLQEHIDHTIANLHDAEDYLDEHEGEITSGKKQVIEAKNDRRRESIDTFDPFDDFKVVPNHSSRDIFANGISSSFDFFIYWESYVHLLLPNIIMTTWNLPLEC